MEFGTAIHRCVCGCGSRVVTPISPTGWQLTYDGESITLDPSIGNWSFECKSHYWIRKSVVEYVVEWSISEHEPKKKNWKKGIKNLIKRKKKQKK
ncbi:DUF6527 family protein [Lacibacter sediminis]|uniref:DUF6527 family protein n=1 Tax=Lacibacter sediminis TaxID=2760713 RepID=UPI00389941F6